jgi:hypothetical protein
MAAPIWLLAATSTKEKLLVEGDTPLLPTDDDTRYTIEKEHIETNPVSLLARIFTIEK